MNRLKRTGLGLFIAAGLSGGISQAPEVLDCQNEEGKNMTVWSRGEIPAAHCDEEFMSDTGNVIHDAAKALTIAVTVGAVGVGSALELTRRREQSPAVRNSL